MKTLMRTILLLVLSASSSLFAQSGGAYQIEKSVIAGGGGQASGGNFALDGTIGQNIAGQKATNAAISVHAGFWNSGNLVPTAADVTVGGRITTANGNGIRNVRVTITNANGESRTARTGTFGYFQFTEVPAGATYIITVVANRYQFSEPTQVHTVVDNIDDISFVALGE